MNGTAPRIAERTLLHHALGIVPGYAPVWLCSRDSCLGIDVPVVLLAFAALALFNSAWFHWMALLIGLPFVIVGFTLVYRFSNRERWGRARLRRIECVWCGRETTPAGSKCPTCQRMT